MENQGLPKAMIMGIVGLIFVVMFGSSMFVTIDSGEKGVLFRKFGGGLQKELVYGQGFHMIAPWNDMFVYDVKLKDTFEKMEVLSKNGLSIKIDLSFRYQPVSDSIGYLHDGIGKNFLESIIKPEIRSVTREVIGNYLPEELYSTKREAIQDEIFQQTADGIGPKHLIIDAVLIRSVKLPAKLEEAIEQKLKEEQLSLQYRYKLDRERQEAERRIIEAQAKADANRILNASLTDKILKDKGIEATLELAKSPNTKTVIIGGAEGGLPLILNN